MNQNKLSKCHFYVFLVLEIQIDIPVTQTEEELGSGDFRISNVFDQDSTGWQWKRSWKLLPPKTYKTSKCKAQKELGAGRTNC